MSVQCWRYSSRIRSEPSERPEQIEAVLQVSKVKNAKRGMTDCPLKTSTHFAQWLEGSFEDLRRIESGIRSDPRHEEVVPFTGDQGEER